MYIRHIKLKFVGKSFLSKMSVKQKNKKEIIENTSYILISIPNYPNKSAWPGFGGCQLRHLRVALIAMFSQKLLL